MLDAETLAEITAGIVREHVRREIEPLRLENQALRERVATLEARKPEKGADGKNGEPGKDGKDADLQAIARIVEGEVIRVVAAQPPAPAGADGKDGEPGPAGEKGEPGKDGAGIADLVIDREGSLVATFTDGRMKNLGLVVGKNGRDGRDGKEGAPGRDGFSLDNFDTRAGEDGRTVELIFEQGDVRYVHELVFPVMIYRDVFKEGQEYEYGDAVTWGGSLWVAQRSTSAKPDGPDSGWKLAVKRGRDGKDAK